MRESEQWTPAATPPDNSRTVLGWLDNGEVIDVFWWRAEKLWYDRYGSKRRRDAVNVVAWQEIQKGDVCESKM